MTTAQEFRSTIGALMEDSAVAGISVTSKYDSLAGMTVTPPAGTIRQKNEVVGVFETVDGARHFWPVASGEEPPLSLRCWGFPWWSSLMRKGRC